MRDSSAGTPNRRVLLAGPLPPPVNGMSTAFALAAGGLSAYGWSVSILDLADRSRPRRRESFTLSRAWSALSCIARSFVRIPRADVFYLTISQSRLGFLKDAAMLMWAFAFRVSTVAHLHGGNMPQLWAGLGPAMRRLFRHIYRHLDVLIVLSEPLRDQFHFLGSDAPPVEVVANGTDLALGLPRAGAREVFRILYLSNMQVEKGYLDVLAMLERLSRPISGRQVEVHFCGSFSIGGPFDRVASMATDFQDRCVRAPPSIRIVYHGLVDRDAKVSLLDSCDALVVPSRIPEGQPLVVIEALTRGLPVVAYDWPGIRAILEGDLAAGLVPVGDCSAMAERLLQWLDDPEDHAAASSLSISIAPRYSGSRHLQQLSDCLDLALASRAKSSSFVS